jgi:YVTN family beta-propeller protein
VKFISLGILWSGILLLLLVAAPPTKAQNLAPVNYPGAPTTELFGINNHGVAVGQFGLPPDGVPDGSTQGFMLSHGNFTSINYPSSTGTEALGINDNGDVVGFYTTSIGGAYHGFLLSAGTYTTIDFPSGLSTEASGINNAGHIVGTYYGTDGNFHGFELTAGVFTTIDCSCGETFLVSINNLGTIVGYYIDASSVLHGLEYSSGNFVTVDYPGVGFTILTGINDTGTLAGLFIDPTDGHEKGFRNTSGQFSTIGTPPAPDTDVDGVSINNSGQIVGSGYYAVSGGAGRTGFFLPTGPYAYVTTGLNAANNLLVIDSQMGLQVSAITLPGYAVGPASTPDGKYVYVTCGTGSPGIIPSNEVCIVDVASNMLVNTIPVGNGAYGIAITPDGTTAYVANNYDSTISVINIASGMVTDTFALGPNPLGVAITPSGQFAYITFTGGVSVVSTANNHVETTIGPFLGAAAYLYPNITPNGKFVYLNANSTSSPGLVSVISTAANAIVGTIDVGNYPISAAISPDSSTVYVDNLGNSTISIINTATNTVIATVPAGGTQTVGGDDFLTPDGSVLWVLNQNNIAQISTATDAVIAQLPYPNTSAGTGIFVNAPASPQSITLPLSPTAANQFNFTSHTFTVQYPAGTSFSGVNMTVVAAEPTQATFLQRVAGTAFANAMCILYTGSGGNCVDYQVTCSDTSGSAISCPSTSTSSITVKTSFDTQQQIINPGFLTTPIGTNDWSNIFDAFYLQRIDPTVKGRTKGFSEFVAVQLGASNDQGAATLQFLWPLRQEDPRTFPAGFVIPASFKLTSIADPGKPVTDAKTQASVQMVADANGNVTSNSMLEEPCLIEHIGGLYFFFLDTRHYTAGTYVLTVYGDAFAAQQVQFTIKPPMRE